MIERNGFWWPADDDWCWRVIHQELPDLDAALAYATGRKVAVQAGGNVGVWAAHLAAMFDYVETAEPDADNYECLIQNVPDNVRHRQAGFGAVAGTIGLDRETGNAGAHHLGGDGVVPIITIDSLGLDACDLIVLDVEGFEPLALRGAEQTIAKFSPVVMFEEKGLSERYYGISRGTAEHWLSTLGYHVADRRRADVIMVR